MSVPLNDQEIVLRLHLLHSAGHLGNAAVPHAWPPIHPILRTPPEDKTVTAVQKAALIGVAIVWAYFLIGIIGTVYVSGQCKDHGYNGGGLNWNYTRYCNAEHFTTVPGPRHIPYSEVVR